MQGHGIFGNFRTYTFPQAARNLEKRLKKKKVFQKVDGVYKSLSG
jgi:hypothetical protein